MEHPDQEFEPAAQDRADPWAVVRPLGRGDPDRLGPYPLVGVLGAGWSGRVYLARDGQGRPLAVKAIRPQYADSPVFRARFRRELEVVRRVRSQRGAPIIDADPDDEQPWLAMACIPGPTLDQALDLHGPLPQTCIRLLAAHLAEALADLHDAGIVHRDLKPGNVLLDADGPKLIDFGVAHIAAATRLTATGAAVGTPAFIAPEQITGAEVTAATDVFALGALLVYAATGTPPFGDEAAQVLYARVVNNEPDLSGLGELSDGLRELIAACLRKNPEDRPDARAVVAACAPSAGAPWYFDGEAPWLPPEVADLVLARRAAVDAVLPGPPMRVVTGGEAAPVPRGRFASVRRPAVAIPVAVAVALIAALVVWGTGSSRGTVRAGAPAAVGTSAGTRGGAGIPPAGSGVTSGDSAGSAPAAAAGPGSADTSLAATSAASGGAVGGGPTSPGGSQSAPAPSGSSSMPAVGGGGHSSVATHPPSSAPAPPVTSTTAAPPQPAPWTCPQHYFCWWSQPGMPGRDTGGCVDASLQHGEWFCTRGFQGMSPPILSYTNATPYRVWLQTNDSHTSPGTELCISPGSSVADLSGNPNTNDHWVWMSNNTAPCS
ncbi:serine/threonine-protein kinase [Catenulispora pinisilvae]|uniref:serine/threonine-protein kinase n=1 Tax=Catenulispora pinisilvae TaxID=2705253 RepID=UPI00189189C1|nr:serine/threonine-protein kinase [Catenulispora pinisilvae]